MRNEFVSAAKAEADYGVVIDTETWTVDAAATERPARRYRRSAAAGARCPRCSGTIPSPQPRGGVARMAGKTTYRVGVDIGGTFTDIVLLGSDGAVHTQKISSSVDNYARAIVEGLGEVFSETGIVAGAWMRSATARRSPPTPSSSTRAPRSGSITTKGFRDVLEIRTLRMPRLYDIAWEKPPPLVERYLRRVVDERVDAKGHVERALDPADAEAQVDALLAEKVEAIAVCLLNSFANPAHELTIKEIVRRKAPQLPVCISYEVLPEIKEYERTSTTVINAYVIGIVGTYLAAMRKRLDAARIKAPLLLMQSNGGLTTDTAAAERPINIIESGPAGGVVGAQALALACQASTRSSPSTWAARPPRPRWWRTAR